MAAQEQSSGSPSPTGTKATLGLTGLTSNAMALIAPGAFLWLTYSMQSTYGSPSAGMSMWFGIALAIALCLATAISYAELSKLYPGAGSSYFFAEQALFSKKMAYRWARVAKFMVGWASHLYYWVYPGVMVGVTALVVGYMVGQIWPATFSASIPSPMFMIGFCVVFAFGVAYIAFRGVGGTTSVNAAINVIQITALIIFSCMAIAHRVKNPEGSVVWTLDANGVPTKVVPQVDASGNPVLDKAGNPVMVDSVVTYQGGIMKDPSTGVTTFLYHNSAMSVIAPHNVNYMFIQACVAILILVGFESVTAMGEEAKNAKRDIPKAVILSLVIQGCFCYLFEYFAANYYIGSHYTNVTGAGSSAPLGDMMKLVGAWAFGSARAGWWFMMIQATTVFLALIGTTLSCLSTGARVTYAMGRDNEVSSSFGILHSTRMTPHRAIWALAIISAVIGIFAVSMNFCGPVAQADATVNALPVNAWYKFGLFPNSVAAGLPQSMLVVTLVSNFGTFLLYMMTCIVAIIAFYEHHTFSGFKHMFVPIFGLLANLACMLFYLIGPFMVPGMSKKEPYFALIVAGVWGAFGAVYFVIASKKRGARIMLDSNPSQNTPVSAA